MRRRLTTSSFIFLLLLVCHFSQAQTTVKANVISVLGFPQVGIETALGQKTSFQVDALASVWKSINGAPQQAYMVIPEFRYYPKKAMEGFYIGGHVGASAFKMQKWSYINTDYYQKGYNVLYGVTVGYQVKINERFAMDAFLGGGSQQAYYNGYLLSTGERYENAKHFNKSGELLPYRGGIMIVYKLNRKNEK
ncbi:DUF3575 domain-containing protein [Flavobacterium sp. GCM10027622]|uniref:DUF3575 domain-containing protein n=1 Tax=unclassified Flavobacterium TaxID=196869 RepID=UPI0036167ECE